MESIDSVAPRHLARRLVSSAEAREGDLVLVWLRIAVRGHENPVLDLGRRLAAAWGLPLLVYHAVSERYPHASDRHHQFILEGARDLVHELDELGVSVACHVERPGHRGPVLRTLAARAALVLTDAMPLDPLRAWTRALSRVAPVVEVDASCTVPMHLLASSPQRAFAFRDASARLRDPVEWPWPEEQAQPRPYDGPLPFEPVDLRSADLAQLVGQCAIDHSVAPVADTIGGSVAGYARWEAFRDGPLSRYGWLRNDAAKHWGVSRMSAYLHYGHVSPFRLAREASERRAKKFLDELLTWREMSWHVCHHQRSPRGADQLPEWAITTLAERADDPRDVLPLEVLEEARTGSRLWDAAQRSLLRHGELHNNVRMTWGKAVLQWSTGPRQTLARLYELNDRYALDGRDPSSVGGIQWCLGGHDRPFSPERPIYGRVRSRAVEHHASRLDLDRYEARVDRPTHRPARVLIVGAGLCGATVAQMLRRFGLDVVVVDKSRGPGGRLSSRRSDDGRYDHGAQSFTARDPRFHRQVRVWEAAGLVAPWKRRQVRRDGDGTWQEDSLAEPRWVVTPRGSALPRHLLADTEVHYGVRAERIERSAPGFVVTGSAGELGRFDRVVITAPSVQAATLCMEASDDLPRQLAGVEWAPCWAGMTSSVLNVDFEAARLDGPGPIGWLSRQDTLPGRTGPERWVIHATADWSARHLEESAEQVAKTLASALTGLVGEPCSSVSVHRWRYARVRTPLGVDHLHDDGLLVAGDACLGPRIESAWLSGAAAAGRLLRRLALDLRGDRRGGGDV